MEVLLVLGGLWLFTRLASNSSSNQQFPLQTDPNAIKPYNQIPPVKATNNNNPPLNYLGPPTANPANTASTSTQSVTTLQPLPYNINGL